MSILDYRSGIDERASRSAARGRLNFIDWAIYLGMSWTWCIGMFLPVLLVRDYGIWGWVVFAVPNVLGAAAMGWVLRDGTSELITYHHRPAISAFSLVTATFQIFFFAWFVGPAVMIIPLGAAFTAVAGITIFCSLKGDRSATRIAAVVFVLSIALASAYCRNGIPSQAFTIGPVSNVFGFGPICFFGFMLCPYLDATFHLARQRQSVSASRASFSMGFGLIFFLMILFSLLYAPGVLKWISNWEYLRQSGLWGTYSDVYADGRIFNYWMLQLALTIGLHWHCPDATRPVAQGTAIVVRVVASILIGISIAIVAQLMNKGELSGERIYRCFLGFYGLVFPAYVWLCMIPGRGRIAPTRRQWTVLAVSVLIASPMFWMGFIENKMFWLLPGLAIVLLARLLIPRPVPVQ